MKRQSVFGLVAAIGLSGALVNGLAPTAVAAAAAQPATDLRRGDHPHPHPPQQPTTTPDGQSTQALVPGQAPATPPPYQPILKRDDKGRPIPVEGSLDIVSMTRNPLIDEAAWKRIIPELREWMLDVEQIVIDNPDFLVDLDKGLIDNVSMKDLTAVRRIMEMMGQFNSAGPLSATLEKRGALTKPQSDLNQQISNEYLQAQMTHLMAEGGIKNERDQPPLNPEQQDLQVNIVNRFLFNYQVRDVVAAYHRLLEAASKDAAKTVAGIGATNKPGVKAALDALKSGGNKAEQMKAMKALMAALDIPQRRTLLQKAQAASPVDPKKVIIDAANGVGGPVPTLP